MAKISQLPPDTTPAVNDLLAIVNNATGATSRMTLSDFSTLMNTLLHPSGIVIETAAATAPTGWLICDGSAISRSTFNALFTAIGTTYGTGDGSLTFNIPNAKGRTSIGKDATQTEFAALGQTGGQKDLMAHSHNAPTTNGVGGPGYEVGGATSGANGAYTSTGYDYGPAVPTTTAGTGVNNLSPYIVFNYIIKT